MKKIIIVLLILFGSNGYAISPGILSGIGNNNAGDYCSSISWSELTSPDFMLDVDNTDNDLYACISGGTETGDADTAHCTPGTPSSGSGAQAICSASGIIQYDNTDGYVDLDQGEIRAKIFILTDGGSISEFLKFGDATNSVTLRLGAGEALLIQHISNSGANTVTSATTIDLTQAMTDGDWIEIWCKWDISRATGDEVTCNAMVEDGTPAWIGWTNSTDADAGSAAGANQPGANEIDFGAVDNNHDIIIDDIEILNTIEGTWEP